MRNVAAGRLRLVISREIESEYLAAPSKKSVLELFASRDVSPDEFLSLVQDICAESERVVPRGCAPPCRDERDRIYLHCCQTAQPQYLITKDADLLELRRIGDTLIVSPGEFLETLRRSGFRLED